MRGSNWAEGQSGEPHGVVAFLDDNGEHDGHVGRIAKCYGAGCRWVLSTVGERRSLGSTGCVGGSSSQVGAVKGGITRAYVELGSGWG